ncbi:MAG: glycosyltransferase family 2 protein, partial [Candidatus Thorarchaeota archaeon]
METSVIVIAYNEEKDIRDCIGAILNQTIKDFELIVVDDGSTDCTGKIVLSFKDPRIKYFKSKKNQGYASARNKGIKHSKGKFIFFTDADCVPKSDWLYQGLKKIKESETIAVVGGKTYFPRTGSSYSASDRVTFEKTYFPPPKRNIASTSNLVYRRSILERVSGFNTRYNDGSEDTDMRLRISRLSGFLLKHNSRMIVYHKFKSMQLNEALSIIKRMSNHVLLIKDHKDH